ncbi:MAG TPA: hypothetical protein VJZ27_01480 [Aggregatilineales bacterium]|nr:hypothetical protein [Aggregatilineales bacterium]
MSDIEAKYLDIVDEFVIKHRATRGHWFSLPAVKINNKIFAALWINGDMIFKLAGDAHTRAMNLEGAKLFQPMEDRSAMKEWVQVPSDYAGQWHDFAVEALEYVREASSGKK